MQNDINPETFCICLSNVGLYLHLNMLMFNNVGIQFRQNKQVTT